MADPRDYYGPPAPPMMSVDPSTQGPVAPNYYGVSVAPPPAPTNGPFFSAAPPPPPPAPVMTPAAPPPGGVDQLPQGIQDKLSTAFGGPPPPATPTTSEWTGAKPLWAGLPGEKPPENIVSAPAPGPIGPPAPARTNSIPEVTVQGRRPAVGGGGGGDFGAGAARRDLYATFGSEKQAISDLATAERAKHDALAAGMAVIGQDRIAEAERRQLEAQHADELFRAHQRDIQDQTDALRQKRVDPTRLFPDAGSKIVALVGGVLGGMYMGLNKLDKNPFLEQMNKDVDRDIALQERELDRQRVGVSEKRNLLRELRDIYKDKDLARAQAKNLYYEGVKEQLAAEAATYDNPAILAKANAAMNGVDRQQAALKLDDAAKKAAAAAAAAAFQRAQEQKAFENQLKLEEAITHRITAERSGHGFKEGQSPRERFVAVSMDPNTKEPLGYLARNATEAGKNQEQVAAVKELIATAERVKAIRAEAGLGGRLLNREPPAGIWTPEWQTKVRADEKQLIGLIKEANRLGALDNGVERFANPIAGSLDSVGSSADVKLDELIAVSKQRLQSHVDAMAGQRARMGQGEDVTFERGVNAPRNDRGSTGVRREGL